ncbi:MAG: iron ABC transporter permease, partial [Calditrichaceae bacterium]
MTKKKKYLLNFLMLLFLISAFIITPLIGESKISISEAFRNFGSMSAEILFGIRLPRIIFSFMVGGGLALVGVIFQALLRNDLATPYTLGVSSGGAFGSVLAIKTGIIFQIAGLSTINIFSVFGSLLSVFLIYIVARNRSGLSTFNLILAGVTISLFFSAVILFIHYLADFTETYRMVRWLMGSLDVSGWNFTIILLVFLLPVYLYFHVNIPAFNLLMAGREVAQSKGVNVSGLQ